MPRPHLPKLPACLACALLVPPIAGPLPAQNVPVEEHVLENGLRLLLLPKKGEPNIAAGWVARVGSVNERPGITGIAHLFEHMMFKGTHAIGTRDIARNLEVMASLDRVKGEIAKEEADLQRRQRLGEVPDPARPEDRSERHRALLAELDDLTKKERELIVKDEFDRIYTAAGATGMNAGTTHDFTIYFINVPANKLELWFWMESDRLLNPVFREFYSERDVVREERRLRIESTPTGRFNEQFDALFWTASPYGWPVIGWPSDIEAVTREEARSFFDIHYAPNNITACLVGDFEPARALDLARRYFGRLKRGPREPEPVRTREPPQLAERRMAVHAETKPQATLRYHTVPDGHADEPALTLLGDILSGRTGRLTKALVLEKQVANEASARQRGMKYEGYFEIAGVAKPGKTPEDVETAIEEEIEKLRSEPVPERELEKVKNQRAASDFRQLRSGFSLLLQLLSRDAYRSWRTINTDPPRVQAVTAADIRRVAAAYLKPENRSVALYYTKEAAPPSSPAPAPAPAAAPGAGGGSRTDAPAGAKEEAGGGTAAAEPEKQHPPLDPAKGAIEGRVVLEGDPPVLRPLDVSASNKDHAACAEHVKDERLLIGEDRAVQNAVISVFGYKPAEKVAPREITLSNEACSFVPRIQATTAGSKLRVTNSDPFLHNTHALLANDFNNAIAKGDEIEKKLPRTGKMLITCDLHPWMQGWIHVFGHDLFDATGADGAYRIVNIPPGEHEIEIVHEVLEGPRRKVRIEAGKTVKLDLVLKARQAKK
jgi:predicted Zn-dependent peptidase